MQLLQYVQSRALISTDFDPPMPQVMPPRHDDPSDEHTLESGSGTIGRAGIEILHDSQCRSTSKMGRMQLCQACCTEALWFSANLSMVQIVHDSSYDSYKHAPLLPGAAAGPCVAMQLYQLVENLMKLQAPKAGLGVLRFYGVLITSICASQNFSNI